MDEIIKSLSSLDKQIEEAKRNVAVLEGRQEELLKHLKTEFGFNSIGEAEDCLMVLKEELSTEEESIKNKFISLKERYVW